MKREIFTLSEERIKHTKPAARWRYSVQRYWIIWYADHLTPSGMPYWLIINYLKNNLLRLHRLTFRQLRPWRSDYLIYLYFLQSGNVFRRKSRKVWRFTPNFSAISFIEHFSLIIFLMTFSFPDNLTCMVFLPFGRPSFVPSAFLRASASRVRCEIRLRSISALRYYKLTY